MSDKFELDNFPTSESAKRQLGYVSQGFYDRSYVGKWLYEVMGLEYDEAHRIVEDLPDQMFPETATWGLMYHEIKWQLPVRLNLSYEERRKLIYEKRDYRAPMTPYRMEKYLKDITDFEVHVSDIHDRGEFYVRYDMLNGAWLLDGSVLLNHAVSSFPHPNIFRVVFIGEGTLNTKRVKKTLDRIKQSHTMYILCEWVIVVLDNQSLEKIRIQSLELLFGVQFFSCRVLNGTWLLDGSVGLCQSVICDMNAGLVIGPIRLFWPGQRIDTGSSIGLFVFGNVRNEVSSVNIGLQINTEISCWGSSVDVSFQVKSEESIDEVFVTIKQDLWSLDGAEMLDGSRLLNAIRREESI